MSKEETTNLDSNLIKMKKNLKLLSTNTAMKSSNNLEYVIPGSISTKNLLDKKTASKLLENIDNEKLSETSKNILNINNIVNNIKSVNINLITNHPTPSGDFNPSSVTNFNKFKKTYSMSNNMISPNNNFYSTRKMFQQEKPSQPSSLLTKNFVVEKSVKENNFINLKQSDVAGFLGKQDYDEDYQGKMKKSTSLKTGLRSVSNGKDLNMNVNASTSNVGSLLNSSGKIVLKGLNRLAALNLNNKEEQEVKRKESDKDINVASSTSLKASTQVNFKVNNKCNADQGLIIKTKQDDGMLAPINSAPKIDQMIKETEGGALSTNQIEVKHKGAKIHKSSKSFGGNNLMSTDLITTQNKDTQNQITGTDEGFGILKKIRIEKKNKGLNTHINKFAVKTRAGKNSDGMRKINQDSFITQPKLIGQEDYSAFGVFDGHGMYGHLASGFVINYIQSFLSKNDFQKDLASLEKDKGQREKIIYDKLTESQYRLLKACFIKCEYELTLTNFDVNFSGTTAVLLMIIKNKLICANAGDSRAILANETSYNPVTEKSTYKVVELSRDHKPDLPDEKERILEYDGRVEPYLEDDGTHNGPHRVWLKHEAFPGLAMSRSIGDIVASSVGVICIPEVFEYTLENNSKFIVIASDGVWEFLSNEKVVEIVGEFYKSGDANGACDKIVKESVKMWQIEDEVIDDITVIVIFLHNNHA